MLELRGRGLGRRSSAPQLRVREAAAFAKHTRAQIDLDLTHEDTAEEWSSGALQRLGTGALGVCPGSGTAPLGRGGHVLARL